MTTMIKSKEREMLRTLLVSATIVGGTGGAAFAQAPANPLQGQLSAPFGAGPATNNNNNAWGIANTPSGSGKAGQLSTLYPPNTVAVPAPGAVVIRLNGRVEVVVTGNQTTADRGLNANGRPNGYKVNPIGIGSFMR